MNMLQKTINFFVYSIVFSLPLYLVNFRVAWIPINILELLICILFIFWLFFVIASARLAARQEAKQSHEKSKIATSPAVLRGPRNDIFLPIFLIFLGVTISTWFSSDLEISAGIWKGWFIIPLLFFIVVINQIKTKKQINSIIISLTLSGTVVSLIALYYWLNGYLTYDGRLSAFYLSANYLAMYLSPIFILSLYLYSLTKTRLLKTLLIISSGLLLLIIYLTYSYGAWLGLLVALIFVLINRGNRKMILIFLFLIVVFVTLQIPSQKFQGFLDLSYPSLKSRLVIWQSAWEIAKDNSLIGIGPGMFQEYYLAYQDKFEPYLEWAVPQPHNLFLAFWLQTGILGLIGLLWLLIFFFKEIEPKYILGPILIAVMIYVLIHGLFDTTYWKNDLAVVFWLVIGLGYRVGRLSY